MTTALLFTGGLDSACALLLHAGQFPRPVYVATGSRYEQAELDTMDNLGIHPHVLVGPDLGALADRTGHVPHRNLLLAATAAAHGYQRIILSAVAGEASPDKTARWARDTSRALTTSENRRHEVLLPYLRWSKTRLVRETVAEHPELTEWLLRTRSCYAPAGTCGQCQACFRRWIALAAAGLQAGPRPRVPRPTAATIHAVPARRWPAVARNNLHAARTLWRNR